MDLKGLAGGQYKPLSEKDIQTIHEAALGILEKTGFTYESGLEATAGMLEAAGARIDRTAARIRFPRKFVLDHIRKAPRTVVLYSRTGRDDLDLTENRVYLGTGGAAIRVIDLETGEYRPTTLKDLYLLARLVDKLDHIHFFLRPCIPTDIPEDAYDVNMFYACMKGTGKHVMSGVNNIDGFHKVLDLASIVAGGREKLIERPFISIITSFAISPLKLCTASTLIMQEAIRHRIPVALSCAPMAGSTSPITMAATLAQIHAEQLAGITICQMTNPGAPLLYGGIPGRANLNTMGYLGGAVECGMMNAAIHQMAHHIGVPNYNSSALTDSKIPDQQAAWEKGMTTLLTAMGGCNYVHHAAGMLDSMVGVAYEQYVIDDEIIGMSCKVLKGIDVDPEHLALEVIDSVGPGGNFMTHAHTLRHMRTEYFNGNGVSDRRSRNKWEQDGGLDARERGRQIARKILSAPELPFLSEAADKAIRRKFTIHL
ncbi:MAG: trimethylamine methyltransferase family protein [Deltaproteobacteria bacterium]|nr:trimethylamine methyltransferase family protein [Deltaproteobacteria bacterium]